MDYVQRYCVRIPGWIGLFDASTASVALQEARKLVEATGGERTSVRPDMVLLATRDDIDWFNQLDAPIVVDNGAIAATKPTIDARVEQIAMSLEGAVEINRVDLHPRHAGVVRRPGRGDMLILAERRADVTGGFLTVLESHDGYPDRIINLESGVVRQVVLQVAIGRELP